MIESLEDILGAGPDDTLGELDGTTYGAISLVVAHDWNTSYVWGFLSDWLKSQECAVITKNQVIENQARAIARLTEERDAARKVVEVLTRKPPAPRVQAQAIRDGNVVADWDGDQWVDRPGTNSHAVPLVPLYLPFCRCEDCEAHRRVLAEGGTITGAPTLPPEVDPKKVCPCDECREWRVLLRSQLVDGWQTAELDGH